MAEPGEVDARTKEGLAVRALILGTIMGTVVKEDYPVQIRDMEEWFDKEDSIQAITAITRSGLRFRITVEFEGDEGEVPT